jgi:hypothetical protein
MMREERWERGWEGCRRKETSFIDGSFEEWREGRGRVNLKRWDLVGINEPFVNV